MWRGEGEEDKNRRCTGDNYDDSNDLALKALVLLSELELYITFGFGGK